jgi:hypothetical protein
VSGAGARAAARGAAREAAPWTTRAFIALAWGLSFHIAIVAGAFGLLRLSAETVLLIAAWKEAAVLLLVSALVVRAAAGRGPVLVVQAADIAVGAVLALAAVHATASLAGLGPSATARDLALATRDVAFCFTLYVIGRVTPDVAGTPRVLGHLFAIGVVTSAVAVLEWWLVPPEGLVLLGVASYFNEFLGLTEVTAGNIFGLPDNYWTMIGGRLVQRAGSVYLSSQGFAIPFLLIIPAATVWMNLRNRWSSATAVAGYALAWLGLLLSVTRMTTVACGLQMLLLLVLARRPARIVAVALVGTATVGVLLVLVPGLASYAWETITWQSYSSASHSKDWVNGLAALWRHPLGSGLGTADQTAMRLGRDPLTADNLFLKYGVELGIPALLAYVATFAAVWWITLRTAIADASPRRRAIAGFVAACTLGVAINGSTAVLTNSPTIGYLYFWLAGSAVAAFGVRAERPRAVARATPAVGEPVLSR